MRSILVRKPTRVPIVSMVIFTRYYLLNSARQKSTLKNSESVLIEIFEKCK